MMRQFLFLIGVPEMPMTSLLLLAAMAVLALLFFGWLADTLLGDGAFGTLGNAILAAFGAIGGAMLWRRYGVPVTGFSPAALVALAASGGAIVMLLLAMLVRRRG